METVEEARGKARQPGPDRPRRRREWKSSRVSGIYFERHCIHVRSIVVQSEADVFTPLAFEHRREQFPEAAADVRREDIAMLRVCTPPADFRAERLPLCSEGPGVRRRFQRSRDFDSPHPQRHVRVDAVAKLLDERILAGCHR